MILARPLACVDIEATGPQPEADRAVEVAVVRLAPDGTRTPLRWLINPERPIPAEATAVHHITDEQVARAPTFAELAHEIAAALRDCDLCGYNLRAFDVPLLRAEFARARVAWTFDGAVVDAYVIFRERERHTLGTAVRWYCGRELVDAHSAVADANATLDVVLAQIERYQDLPRDMTALDLASGGRQPDWATELGHLRWRDDGDLYVAWGRHAGRRLVDLDDGFLRWVLRNDFPADVHAFVRDAYRGERPRAPGAAPPPPESEDSDDPDDHWDGGPPQAPAPAPAPQASAAADDNDIPF